MRVPLAHIVEPAEVVAGLGEEVFQLRLVILRAADKASIRTAAALNGKFDQAEQLVPHVFAHQQPADFPPAGAP